MKVKKNKNKKGFIPQPVFLVTLYENEVLRHCPTLILLIQRHSLYVAWSGYYEFQHGTTGLQKWRAHRLSPHFSLFALAGSDISVSLLRHFLLIDPHVTSRYLTINFLRYLTRSSIHKFFATVTPDIHRLVVG
jgi:hypothetical protein